MDEGHVKMEAEISLMLPQLKEWLEATRGWKRQGGRELNPVDTLILTQC